MGKQRRQRRAKPGPTSSRRPSLVVQEGLGSLLETGFLRQPTVLRYIPWSKSTLWEKVARGEFPAPVKLSKNITAWRAEDVRRAIIELGGKAA